jgi:hypothetical protein
MSTSVLRVEPDPALALVVRIFVGAVSERLGVPDDARDDLRLAASELFSGAVEAGGGEAVTFRLSSQGDRLTLDAEGVGSPAEEGSSDALGAKGRFGLVRALFPEAEIGDHVRIRAPAAV